MKFCKQIDVNEENAIKHAWPATIDVERGMVDTPPSFVRIGRHGALNIYCKNGMARYWRDSDLSNGWRYRLIEQSPAVPVPA